MRVWRFILVLILSLAGPLVGLGAEAPEAHGGEAEAEGGLPTAAPVLFHIGPLPVTNSMVATWIVGIAIIVFARRALRNPQLVPKGAQNFWEFLVEGLYEFLEGIIGAHLVKKTYWFFATVFIVIWMTNWAGLIPGIGTVGFGVQTAHGFHVTDPLFRGVHADFNMTFAIALLFFALWIIWAVQENGVGGFLKHLFAPKGDTTGPMFLLMVVVFFAVGLLEVVSILFRPISLSFRLYGNIFAGENMLEAMTHLGGPWLGWLFALPFYFMELLVGVVQALVFMLLTAVFTLLICMHDEEEGHGAKAHAAAH
ncbi:MAG TPA: F0F1 ATP synthase subunit A [Verrucomicrobiota bacterium]|nr:F0F1 ATP synthase subunit A [Verrucomicrobiales bacterium]HRI13102.1 F0F1 ATP synthase subunit A [Verrucomicrobiota bacterium]